MHCPNMQTTTNTTITIQGRDAIHTVTIIDEEVGAVRIKELGLKRWSPENSKNGNDGFSTIGNATSWLKKQLGVKKGVGWPEATAWEIRPATVTPAWFAKDQTVRVYYRVYNKLSARQLARGW